MRDIAAVFAALPMFVKVILHTMNPYSGVINYPVSLFLEQKEPLRLRFCNI